MTHQKKDDPCLVRMPGKVEQRGEAYHPSHQEKEEPMMEEEKQPESNFCSRYRSDVCFLAGQKDKELKIPAGQLKTYLALQKIAAWASNKPDEGRLKLKEQEH